ncbi:hypothetical protein M8998_13560 [Sphingobacterium sp. lm-10]|uniref:hypothetical protein n=1 Tax=Sphingobacterium sp. lm-10 TaxID=2944904 RepID=UPI00201FB57A|nr:hypothetical protein [Sphingobacterium sp. lm-10]MCL7988972.1 hypothetical protein [Sphingobacterium sp. lm-10]
MRLSPLNIVLACILVWAISEMGEEGKALFSWGWLILLVIVVLVVDILFRLWARDTQKLWWMQIAFIVSTAVCAVLIKIM